MVHHPSGAARGQVRSSACAAALRRLPPGWRALGAASRRSPTRPPCARAPPLLPAQASDINREAKELLRIRDYMDAILAQATGQPFDKVARDFRCAPGQPPRPQRRRRLLGVGAGCGAAPARGRPAHGRPAPDRCAPTCAPPPPLQPQQVL